MRPLWLVGFRPFFPLAGISAALLPLIWVLLLTGTLTSSPSIPMLNWHAHEMFFGFGMAVLGGFLLTATKNWVQVRGHHGLALQLLVAAWLLERVAMWWGAAWPRPLFLLASHLFLGTLILLLLWTLIRHRATDTYKDNFVFVLVLPIFFVAKALLLHEPTFALGRELTIGLFRVAFLVMLERTIPPFMKGAFQLTLRKVFAVDTSIKALGVLLLLGPWLPALPRTVICVVLAALLLTRLAYWSPHRALTRLDTAVMYLGSAALAGQLLVDAFSATWVGTLSVHLFTFGTMGLIIPAMITRIAKGHTGRPVAFDLFDKTAIVLMMVGFLARVVAPQFFPAEYRTWVWIAAGCWSACFALITARITPLVLRPRVDGKEH